MKLLKTALYLLLIDEEAEIKEGDYYFSKNNNIVTTCDSKEEAKECAVLRHNDFKIIAYYPLTKEAKELDLPLLPNPFEEVPLMKQASELRELRGYHKDNHYSFCGGFIEGYKAAQSKQFSLEDIIAFGKKCFYKGFDKSENDDANSFTAWREECSKLIQSLSTQQLPSEFIPEYEYQTREGEWKSVLLPSGQFGSDEGDNPKRLKIVNSMGKKMLVGKYK